jgi:predicted transport protein
MNSIDKAEKTMLDNLFKNTGKTIEQWIDIVKKQKFEKHGEIVNFLKDKYTLTYGYANLVAHKSNASDAGSVENKNDLIEKQYKGKEHFKPIYEKLMSEILKFGNDIEIAPKNAYVALRRKKQFAMLQPATKTRFEIGLNLKGEPNNGKLVSAGSNLMCSHKINLTSEEDIDKEVVKWIRESYERAG